MIVQIQTFLNKKYKICILHLYAESWIKENQLL